MTGIRYCTECGDYYAEWLDKGRIVRGPCMCLRDVINQLKEKGHSETEEEEDFGDRNRRFGDRNRVRR